MSLTLLYERLVLTTRGLAADGMTLLRGLADQALAKGGTEPPLGAPHTRRDDNRGLRTETG